MASAEWAFLVSLESWPQGPRTRRCSHQPVDSSQGKWGAGAPFSSAYLPITRTGGSCYGDAGSPALHRWPLEQSVSSADEAEQVSCRTYTQLFFYPSLSTHPPRAHSLKHQALVLWEPEPTAWLTVNMNECALWSVCISAFLALKR